MRFLSKTAVVAFIAFVIALLLSNTPHSSDNKYLVVEFPKIFATGGATLRSLPVKIQIPDPSKSYKAKIYLVYRGKPISPVENLVINPQKQLYRLDWQLTLPKAILSAHTYHYKVHIVAQQFSQDIALPVTVYPAFYPIPFSSDKGLFHGVRINSVYICHDIIYLATDHGLAISPNYGVSWREITTAQGIKSNNINQVFSNKTHLILATDNGVSISLNHGKIWINTTEQNGLPSNIVYGVYMVHDTIYAATEKGGRLF